MGIACRYSFAYLLVSFSRLKATCGIAESDLTFITGARFVRARSCGLRVCGQKPADLRTDEETYVKPAITSE